MPQVGDQFPAFSLSDQDGNIVTNSDLLGSKSVVYFYPKDDTPGCTAEACEFPAQRSMVSLLIRPKSIESSPTNLA